MAEGFGPSPFPRHPLFDFVRKRDFPFGNLSFKRKPITNFLLQNGLKEVTALLLQRNRLRLDILTGNNCYS